MDNSPGNDLFWGRVANLRLGVLEVYLPHGIVSAESKHNMILYSQLLLVGRVSVLSTLE